MQLIDFRKDTCEVYIWAYYGKDCNNPENEAQWVVTHYFVNWGVVKAGQVKYIAWTDRETATYSPHEIDQGNIPSVILDNLLNCATGDNFDYEKLILCHPIEWKVIMESWTDITDPTQTPTRRYIILSSWLEYTWPVSELEDCGAEKYDIVYAWDFCDGWVDLSRYDIIDLSDQSIQGSYFTNNLWVIVVPVNPIKWACTIWAVGYAKVIDWKLIDSIVWASITYTFDSPVSDVDIYNDTNGYANITYVNSIPTTWNNLSPIAPGQSIAFNSKDETQLISGVIITDIDSSSIGKYAIKGVRL